MASLYDVLIIGGGAAGLMSAVRLQNRGLRIALLERNSRIGKKLLVTGNGRCNFTNVYAGIRDYSGEDPGFASPALESFSPDDVQSFFRTLGIEPKVETGGKVFPSSEQAGSFLDLFLLALKEGDAQVCTDDMVLELRKKKDTFRIRTESGNTYVARNILLCTGGKAMPSSGSDGNGYALATSFGHTLTPLIPSLVQLMLEGNYFSRIEGVKLKRRLHLGLGEEILQSEEGDVLFASYGLSGPPALQLSRLAGTLLSKKKKPWVSVSLFDDSLQGSYERLTERFSLFPTRNVSDALIGLIHKRLIPVLLQEAQISEKNRPCASLTKKETYELARLLIDWRIPIRGLKSWPSAQVTAGGISTREVDPFTMESRKVKGLYFAGEILDIDGRSGGYNLQWAWSSATSAAEAILSSARNV